MEKHRSLIRIEEVHETLVILVVPSWDSEIKIVVARDTVPESVLSKVKGISRTHAFVNLHAEKPSELDISDWGDVCNEDELDKIIAQG